MREPTFSNEIGRINKQINKQMDSLETKLVSAKDLIDFCIFWINEYEQSCSPLAKAKIVELNNVIGQVVGMPHEEPEADEWCTDCKEYDSEKHCCPRYNRVIRETVKEIQAERKSVIYYVDGYSDGCMMYDTAECPSCGYIFDEDDSVWKEPFCPHCGQELEWEGEQCETD